MPRKKSYLTVTDQFCGAGGSSIGAKKAGAELRMALNHWKLAVETHNTNFPNADHDCVDISACDPRRYPSTDILITSPECFPKGTIVLTKIGLIPIENIKVDDLVLTHKNEWKPVVEIMRHIGDTIFVNGQGNNNFEITTSHPILIRKQFQTYNNEKRDYDRRQLHDQEWKEAGNLKDGIFRWATPINIPHLDIPQVVGKNNRWMDFTNQFWWMVGRWLGDGCVRIRENYSNDITICCGKHEVDHLEKMLSFFNPIAGYAKENTTKWRKREIRTSFLFETTNDCLGSWLVDNFGKLAHGKTLPVWVFSMNRNWREALLAGYVSSDGSINERYTQTSSVSKMLALGMKLLSCSLGFHACFGCYRHRGGEIEGRKFKEYDLWMVKWENNKSQRSGIIDGNHAWTLIKNISSGRRDIELFNLAIQDDESYIADGIVVHNCTNHSLSKGRKRKNLSQKDFFGTNKISPDEERSRATMWDVPRFAEFHQYEIIIVENVVDARYWVMFDAWLHAMQLIGYDHKTVYFNSMFAHPTPQSRDRMYVVFWKKSRKKPNLDFTPKAHCPRCEKDVYAKQAWKKADRMYGKYRVQYIYACPSCGIEVMPYYYCAFNAIDWNIPITRIGDRDKPLREKTLERIRMGLRKYAREAILIANFNPGWARRLTEPTGTITTQDHHALAVPPFIIETKYSHAQNDRSKNINAPLLTQSTQASQALVVSPFVLNMQSNNRASGLNEALTTVLTGDHKYLTMPPYVIKFRNNADAGRITESLNTVSAGGINHGLCMPSFLIRFCKGSNTRLTDEMPTVTTRDKNGLIISSFIYSYYTRLYGKKAAIAGINEALPVQPGSEKHALVCSEICDDDLPRVEDCYFRMLQPSEIHTAMAFPDNYVVLGNKRDRVKQLGNAVTPPVMEMLLKRCIETFI